MLSREVRKYLYYIVGAGRERPRLRKVFFLCSREVPSITTLPIRFRSCSGSVYLVVISLIEVNGMRGAASSGWRITAYNSA